MSRRTRRQRERQQRFGRFLWFAALGSLIPGAGLVAAGRASGKVLLWLVGISAAVAGVIVWQTGLRGLVDMAADTTTLGILAFGALVLAVGWLTVALVSHRALEPNGLPSGKRLAGSVVVITTVSLVVAPLAYGARTAWTARDTIGAVASDSDTATEIDDHKDPWKDLPRVTILIMGSDAGPGRAGTRPDTLIAASIDTHTGDAILFSLPRQLANVPFPDGSVLDTWYPRGFAGVDGGDPFHADNWINAVYRNTPEDILAEAFPTSEDPRADATKSAVSAVLGIPIDFYVLADLNGFERLVDAMGGVTIDVPYPIPISSKKIDGGCKPPKDWILPGDEKLLSGWEALWFGRARCAPDYPGFDYTPFGGNPVKDDHNRMERQRCIIGAIARSADPFTLLTNFESLAGAAQSSVATDVPPSLWSQFAELGMKIKDAEISSIVFNKDGLAEANAGFTYDADFDAIAFAVAEAIGDASSDPEPAGTTAEQQDAGTQDSVDDDPAQEDPAAGSDPGTGGGSQAGTGDTAADPGGASTEPDPGPTENVATTC